jgi:uncharacterized circularly permuted ATP-grasp superfamily protein
MRLTRYWLLFFLGIASAQAEPAYYDEMRTVDGALRPQYEEVHKIHSGLSKTRKKKFLRATKADFKGDNALSPLPRILTESESDLLVRGVEQRGNALRAFLQDHYSGRKTYRKLVGEETIRQIFARSHELGYEGLIRPESIAFRLREDIIRGPNGSFYVIEDNPGFVGGPGDLSQARESLMKRIPEYKDAIQPLDDPMDYYRTLVARAKARAHPKDGKIVYYTVPPYSDGEDKRLQKIFKDLDVEIITSNTQKQLIVRDDGVFIRSSDSIGRNRHQKVGFLMLQTEHRDLDMTHPVAREVRIHTSAQEFLDDDKTRVAVKKRLKELMVPNPTTGNIDYSALERYMKGFPDSGLAEALRGTNPGIVSAIASGKVPTDYIPGVEAVGDKQFYTYVEDFIQHYLNEKPILRNIPTRDFSKNVSGKKVFDQEYFDWLFKDSNYKKYVIKIVDGRGGDSVWVGPKLKKAMLKPIKEKILARWEAFIVQEFTHLSVLNGAIVDIGALADVGPKDTYASRTFWGRSIPVTEKSGLVNLSKNGVESPILVVKDPPGDCVPLRALVDGP